MKVNNLNLEKVSGSGAVAISNICGLFGSGLVTFAAGTSMAVEGAKRALKKGSDKKEKVLGALESCSGILLAAISGFPIGCATYSSYCCAQSVDNKSRRRKNN